MASSVGLREAQEHLGELLDRVERGEEIVIERDGRAVSKLVPVAARRSRSRRGELGGRTCLGLRISRRTSMSR